MSADAPAETGRRAWDWMVRHERDFYAPGTGQGADQKRAKYAAELALIAGTLVDDLPEAPALLAGAWEALERGELIVRLLATWPIAATSYLPFRLAGFRSAALDARLADGAWRGDARWAPFVRFALGITLESIGVAWPWDQGQVVLANRFFDRPTPETPPIRAEFLAHAIMWRSNMGRHRAGLGDPATALYREVSPLWHCLLARSGLLDPLGEMIIADLCAGVEPPPASLAGLAAGQRDDGTVVPHRDHPATAFDEVYHSTCVAALAGTLATRPRPPSRSVVVQRTEDPDGPGPATTA